MPVYEQSYPRWTPSAPTRLRWLPIIRRELQVLLAQRGFRLLLFGATIPIFIHLLQIYSVNKLAADPQSELARVLRGIESVKVDPEFFFQFLTIQSYGVFILLLYSASGSICDDIRLNLSEVYFSKPLTRRDYLLGKILTVGGVGLAYTALPALFLFLAHVMMQSDASFLREYAWLPLSCLAFSLAVVIPIALGTLACSALTPSRRYAAAALITIVAANSFLASMLADLLEMRSAMIVSFPAALLRLGESLFDVRPYIPLSWTWALLVLGAIPVISLLVLGGRLRAVELGR